MAFNRELVPVDMPEERVEIVTKAFNEIIEIVSKYEMNAADVLVCACTLFDTAFEEKSIEAMETCVMYMNMVKDFLEEGE